MSLREFGRSWQQNDKIQGLLFDGAMFLANFYLLGSINRAPVEAYSDLEIGLLLGAAALAQFLGALMKKRPLPPLASSAAPCCSLFSDHRQRAMRASRPPTRRSWPIYYC